MQTAGLVVLTITLARDLREEEFLLDALRALKKCGLPVIAADGGSRIEFVKKLRAMEFTVVRPRTRKLVAQVQAGLGYALLKFPGRHILYTEPDKYPFFKAALNFVRKGKDESKVGVIVAARDRASFATFPEGQQCAETVANRATDLYLGGKQRRDYCYGPLLMSKRAAEIALEAPQDLGWGWRLYVLGRLAIEGKHLQAVEMSFPCPLEQRGEDSREDRIYRIKQLRQNLEALEIAFQKNPLR